MWDKIKFPQRSGQLMPKLKKNFGLFCRDYGRGFGGIPDDLIFTPPLLRPGHALGVKEVTNFLQSPVVSSFILLSAKKMSRDLGAKTRPREFI